MFMEFPITHNLCSIFDRPLISMATVKKTKLLFVKLSCLSLYHQYIFLHVQTSVQSTIIIKFILNYHSGMIMSQKAPQTQRVLISGSYCSLVS